MIYADNIRGPWSEPIDLKTKGQIDPGHVVGEDGRRYLFTNGIKKIRLTDNGLATDGVLEQAYAPWHYPDDWVVESFAPEGPKLLHRDDWFYLVTGHMVIAARSRSVQGHGSTARRIRWCGPSRPRNHGGREDMPRW